MTYIIEATEDTTNVIVKSLYLFSSMNDDTRHAQIALQSAYVIDCALNKNKRKPLRLADEPLPKVKVQEE